MAVLKWLRSKGISFVPEAKLRAARGGHLRVLQYLYHLDKQLDVAECGRWAAACGHWEVLFWLIRKWRRWYTQWVYEAMAFGQVEVVRRMWRHGIGCDARVYHWLRSHYEHDQEQHDAYCRRCERRG